VLYNFAPNQDGVSFPYGGLTLGTDGLFYGTRVGNPPLGSDQGTLFAITAAGELTDLYNFVGGSNGGGPIGAPTQGVDGNLYGTTASGGLCSAIAQGCGTVYKSTRSGFSTLHQFDLADGYWPEATLIQATDGNFYGTTPYGGPNNCFNGFNCGNVFKIAPSGKLTVLYNFTFDATTGFTPYAPLVQGADGNFYGTTAGDEVAGDSYGSVFKLTPSGNFTTLHNFSYADATLALAGLVEGSDGKFYGMTTGCDGTGWGSIYRISPHGRFSVLYNFDGSTAGCPTSLVQHTNGILYGEAEYGGTFNQGVIFSFNLGLRPFVRLLSTSGKVGKTVGILGQGFRKATGVSFNGTPATFRVEASSSYLAAIVPVGATTGFVTVTTPSGTLTSNQEFRVTP